MVNARELDEDQLASHLQTRAVQSQRKGALKRLIANIKKHPQFAHQLDTQLANILRAEGLQITEVVKKRKGASLQRLPAKKAKVVGASPSEGGDMTDDLEGLDADDDDDEDNNGGITGKGDTGPGGGASEELCNLIANNPYRKLLDWPITALQELLEIMNPISMSRILTGLYVRRGKRRENQEALCELVEFSCGLGPSFAPRKNYSNAAEFVHFIMAEFKKRGSRGAKLQIHPLDMEANGLFAKVLHGNGVSVRHQFTHAESVVPTSCTSTWDMGDLHFENNHSETSAILTSGKAGSGRFAITFANHFVGEFANIASCGAEAKSAQGGEMIEDVPKVAVRRNTAAKRAEAKALAQKKDPAAVVEPKIASQPLEGAVINTAMSQFFKGSSFKLSPSTTSDESKVLFKPEKPCPSKGVARFQCAGVTDDLTEVPPLPPKGKKIVGKK
jgi:hypothetical protein